MKTFLEWLRLSEANITDKALINYALRIESDPRLDDLETMLSMLKKHSEGLWPPGAVEMLLMRMKTVAEKLPEPDKSKALKSVGEAKKEIEENINSTRTARREMISGKNRPGAGNDSKSSPQEFLRDLERQDISDEERMHHLLDRLGRSWGITDENEAFVHAVEEYLRNVLFIDLESMDEDADETTKAYGIIWDQWDSGERDVAAAALKVKEFLG